MALIEWDESFAVNVREIDGQHKMLVTLLNQLHEAMKFGRGNEILGEVFIEVVEYTRYHFATEERLMRENGFPEYLLHKALHEDLRTRLTEWRRDFDDDGRTSLGIGSILFLRDWLINHIAVKDRPLGDYLKKQGVLGPARVRLAS